MARTVLAGMRHGRGRERTGRGGEQLWCRGRGPDSYYGKPIIKAPVWRSPDVPGYLFLGGLAGASSVLAGFAARGRQPRSWPGRRRSARPGRSGCPAVALVHDLGRPERFLNMLRVFKVTSPMSVGSWLLSAYGPAAARPRVHRRPAGMRR